METNWEALGPEGLVFFGRVCASISHELKNSLALINENAGLMQDLLVLAERGQPLDPARVATSMERIARHVERANATIGTLNRFAHLIDEPLRGLDLRAETALALRLHERPASQAQVEMALVDGPEVPLTTRPFLLGNALHLCLRAALAAKGAALTVLVRSTDAGAEVLLTGLPDEVPGPAGEHAEALFAALGATCTRDGDALSLVLENTAT